MWNSIPEEKQRVFNVSTLRELRTCERDQELLDVSELLFRFATARLKGLGSRPAPPWERCLDVWSFFSEGVRGFLHSLPASFAFSEKKHCTLKQRFQFKVGVIRAVVNIRY